MPVANVGDADLWYDFIGAADARRTVVLVHGGLGFDHHYMVNLFGRLASDGVRVLAYDHRANGASTGDPASITMPRLADDLAALLDHVGIQRAVLLGHSYGGFVAQEFAISHPTRTEALILVDTTPGQLGTGEVEDEHGHGPTPPQAWLDLMAQPPTTDEEFGAQLLPMMRFYLRDHDPDNPRLAAARAAVAGTVTRVVPMLHGFMALSQWSAVDRLSSITCPTLLLVGRHDHHTAWPQSFRIASRVQGAEVVIFEDSGHFPMIEEPDRFFAVLEDWLAALPA